jgi:hypothetical protein
MTRLIKRTLKISGLAVGILTLIFGIWFYDRFILSPLDRPWILSDHEETITLTYVNWACDCADFVETKHFKENPISEPKSDAYIFIEPSRPELKLDTGFYSEQHFYKYIRLTGRFYLDKGIPESYEMKTPEKPDHAKVFRYDKIEYIDMQEEK